MEFLFLGRICFFSNLSIAVGNVFLGLTLVDLCCRIWLKYDDWTVFLKLDKGVVLVIGLLIGSTFLSAVFSGDPEGSLQVFADYYIYRFLGLFAVLITVRDRRRLFILLKLVAISFMINVFMFYGRVESVMFHEPKALFFICQRRLFLLSGCRYLCSCGCS